MITRRQFLTRIAAAPGIVATGSLWADDKIVAAASTVIVCGFFSNTFGFGISHLKVTR